MALAFLIANYYNFKKLKLITSNHLYNKNNEFKFKIFLKGLSL